MAWPCPTNLHGLHEVDIAPALAVHGHALCSQPVQGVACPYWRQGPGHAARVAAGESTGQNALNWRRGVPQWGKGDNARPKFVQHGGQIRIAKAESFIPGQTHNRPAPALGAGWVLRLCV